MNKTTRELALQAIIAAVYVVLTFFFQAFSFMPEQFRVSEFLLILVLINPKNALGIVLGTMLANTFSAAGPIDIVVGTFATYVALQMMVRIKIKWLRYLAPAIANGIIIGLMLSALFEFPLYYSISSVFISESVVTFIPWLICGDLIVKNKMLRRIFA